MKQKTMPVRNTREEHRRTKCRGAWGKPSPLFQSFEAGIRCGLLWFRRNFGHYIIPERARGPEKSSAALSDFFMGANY
jgi:hypothetical protein